jgi:saccharopine dehydrogenase (NADP+, L-glutamate forming)/spermidine synthase
MKKIFVAGAGLVVRPLVGYLLDQPGFLVEVGDVEPDRAARIVAGHPRGTAVTLDIQDAAALRERIAGADLVVSMVPYTFHPLLGRMAIDLGKPMITASYVSPAMKALDEDAKRNGVILLNELGLDPGIDHMEAMRIIRRIKDGGGEVLGFVSWCGGLPAPEANTNPFGYKFSWSPKGVLLAGKNSARYLEDGKVVFIPSENLFESCRTVSVPGCGNFEGYPNRDSVPYAEAYGIPQAKTMLRGTLRYPGWCSTMKKIGDLGLLDQAERSLTGMTYAALARELAHASPDRDLKKALGRTLGLDPGSAVIGRMEWLGLLDEKPIPAGNATALDALAALMIEKLRYEEGERDMIVLRHEFLASWPDGSTERIASTLIDHGIPHGDSSMSRTVGLPAAIGARLILEGKILKTGVQTPLDPSIYEPILDELSRHGIVFHEERLPTKA